MVEVKLTSATKALAWLGALIWPRVRRLYAERSAGRWGVGLNVNLLEQEWEAALKRLQGSVPDEAWWEQFLIRVEHHIVAPNFFRVDAVREWLAEHQVRCDLTALAKARLLGHDKDDAEARGRLRQAYLRRTGEGAHVADDRIEVALAVLAAGFIASIEPSQRTMFAYGQAAAADNLRLHRETQARQEDGFAAIQDRLDSLSDPLREMWERLRPTLEGPAAPRGAQGPPSTSVLPPPVADFTGRVALIRDLIGHLTSRDGRPVIATLRGMPGVGKSALAAELKLQIQESFADGILALDLRGFSDEDPPTPNQIMADVITRLSPGADVSNSREELAWRYQQTLTGRRMLLIFDNARDTAQVQPLAPPAGVAMLVTSRSAIYLPGAEEHLIAGLPEQEAAEFLRKVLGMRHIPSEDLIKLAGQCAGLPLALRAAGTYLRRRGGTSVERYVEMLADTRQRLSALSVEPALLDVRASLRLSLDALEEEDRQLAEQWQQLAVFRARWLAGMAAHVWGWNDEQRASDALDNLVSRSMLERHDRAFERESRFGDYGMHDLFRDLALETIGAAAHATALERHASGCLSLLVRTGAAFERNEPDTAAWMNILGMVWPEVDAAQRWVMSLENPSQEQRRLILGYARKGAQILDVRLPAPERAEWHRRAAEACHRIGEESTEQASLGCLATAVGQLGQLEKARRLFARSVRLARKHGCRLSIVASFTNVGNFERDAGRPMKALACYRLAAQIAGSIPGSKGATAAKGRAIGAMAIVLQTLKRYGEAAQALDERLALARECGDRHGEGIALSNRFGFRVMRGDAKGALEDAMAAVALLRACGDPRGLELEALLREAGVELG